MLPDFLMVFECLRRGPSRCNRDLCVVATSSALPSRPDIHSEIVEKERVRSMDSHQRARGDRAKKSELK
jgi:hypothetical protein